MSTGTELKDGGLRYYGRESELRIVHLLKQGVGSQNVGNYSSLIEMIEKDYEENRPLPKMWKVCSRWSYALRCLVLDKTLLSWGDIENLDDSKLWCELLKTAVVNVIKVTGDSNTLNKDLVETAKNKEKRDRLIAQIDCLQPSVVICGGTFDVFIDKVLEKKAEISETDCGYRQKGQSGMRFLFLKPEKRLYIDAYHPSYHFIKHRVSYTNFVKCIEEIVRQKQITLL